MSSSLYLSTEEARKFYDRMGRRQDWQRIYEGEAIAELLKHGDFDSAKTVFELGCGTGALAEKLLNEYLPADAKYVGIDISPVMVNLSKIRLAPFGDRAKVYHSDGHFNFDPYISSCDRFVSVYVLDLLPPDNIEDVLTQASGKLASNGKLCLISLTEGCTPSSKLIVSMWKKLRNINPKLVGGCRPIRLSQFLATSEWQIEFDKTLSVIGVPSEVVVASKLNDQNSKVLYAKGCAVMLIA